ncbi:hypothetical protein MELE44368_21750 [Mycolicibacterium elephantis DSM 44368]|uniref:Uncharacterized protein n=1 Tax=Mycolicibacterium elephantis DSM 44368 TaxID=1335622 RepID=A0A439DS95_9MYCO|nr:hypothetical protein MELE44368_21750 [Mycolicibacterium elephantis DSM 44368]
MRISAGVCTLALGLFIGSAGAVAAADSDTGGSSTSSQGTTGTDQGQESSSKPSNKLTAGFGIRTPKFTTGIVRVGATPFAEDDTATTGEAEEPASTDLVTDDEDDAAAGVSDVDENTTAEDSEVTILPAADPDGAADTTPAAASTTPAAGSPEPTAPASASPKPSWRSSLQSALTRTPPAPEGVPDRFSPYYSTQFLKAIEPITNAFTTVVQVMETVPRTLAALPTSKTPITDVITSMQYMLSTVVEAVVPIVYVPRNLYALMVTVPPVTPPVFAGPVTSERPTPVPAGEAPLFGPQMAQVPYLAPAGAPLFGTMTPRAALGTVVSSGLNKPLSVAGTVPAASEAAKPPAAKWFLDHVVSAVLVPASLTALAALALPGVAGLLVIVAAGIRLGYRQAKAAFVMRASGIARFAGSGPVGVVRSGSFITLRQRARGPRTKRAVCPQSAGVVRTLEEVA